MGITRAMLYNDAVASVPAKGATMFGYHFRLLCIVGLYERHARSASRRPLRRKRMIPGLVLCRTSSAIR